MLVLSRKVDEAVVLSGGIRITVTAIRGRQVRIAVEAPQETPIARQELLSSPGPDSVRRAGPPHLDHERSKRATRLRAADRHPPSGRATQT